LAIAKGAKLEGIVRVPKIVNYDEEEYEKRATARVTMPVSSFGYGDESKKEL